MSNNLTFVAVLTGTLGMIQRSQSVYLLLASLLSAVYFLFPFSAKIFNNDGAEIIYRLTVYGVEESPSGVMDSNLILMLLVLFLALICMIAIFLYDNRGLQSKICWLAVLPCLAIITVDYFLSDMMGSQMGDKKPVYLYSSYVPFIQLLLIRLAIRGIKKDEQLIRSADRIR